MNESESQRDASTMRAAALYALLRRAGGRVTIGPAELPTLPFTIYRRWTEDDGIEIGVTIDGRMQ